ncbi:MAG: dephospho-CoA kinase [Candidatus Binataceae bacterium]
MLTIGLTGGIGSGKSTVAAILAELGALVWDADRIGHTVYAPGTAAYRDLLAEFGSGILGDDSAVNRKKLGAIVFSDRDALARLNAIVHPRIFERMAAMIGEARTAGEKRIIVIEAAVLIEAGWQSLFNEIWLVETAHGLVIERVGRDRKMSPEQADARIRAQLADTERRAHASVVIANNGTLEDLRAQTARVYNEALQRDH